MPTPALARVLARSLISGEQTIDGVIARATQTLGRSWTWLRPVARRYIRHFAGRIRPRQQEVVEFLFHDPAFLRAWRHYRLKIHRWIAEPQQMQPVAAAAGWPIPAIDSPGALAGWLGITAGELDWFADLRSLEHDRHTRQVLRHYRYRALTKQSGRIRLIEAPKPRLKVLQRRILAGILEKIPPHPAVHGFVQGRSIRTFAVPHAGRQVVLRMDLRDFFPSIRRARIQALFRTLGYPEPVADLLGGICTNAAPHDAWKNPGLDVDLHQLWEARVLYSHPHLPQGAPTSPALANLCAYRVDCRLAGLAQSAGAHYTRYADDLAFSGGDEFGRCVERFSLHVAAVLEEEGFHVHHRKTRIMRRGVRQHLAGLVVNRHPNVMRRDFERLKAILTNCVRLGPESQNRDAHPHFRMHLEGRVSFVESINPGKGKRLRAIFDRISWTE
ncbi:MAG TPA: reverse transcriptase family protein [Bryobacteraceae bacterium]|nr:reverse transcriptase family protein [Bryobacteraceae bacterium]